MAGSISPTPVASDRGWPDAVVDAVARAIDPAMWDEEVMVPVGGPGICPFREPLRRKARAALEVMDAQHTAALAEAVQAEREACAKMVERLDEEDEEGLDLVWAYGREIAAEIRARGTTSALDRTEAGVRE